LCACYLTLCLTRYELAYWLCSNYRAALSCSSDKVNLHQAQPAFSAVSSYIKLGTPVIARSLRLPLAANRHGLAALGVFYIITLRKISRFNGFSKPGTTFAFDTGNHQFKPIMAADTGLG
jgi:hypothetical protein